MRARDLLIVERALLCFRGRPSTPDGAPAIATHGRTRYSAQVFLQPRKNDIAMRTSRRGLPVTRASLVGSTEAFQ